MIRYGGGHDKAESRKGKVGRAGAGHRDGQGHSNTPPCLDRVKGMTGARAQCKRKADGTVERRVSRD